MKRKIKKLILDSTPEIAAKFAGLRYVNGEEVGITRLRSGKGFRYLTASGKTLRNPKILKRVRGLVIPPAWKNVWICSDANGHLQATGIDARGRKQYRYHSHWRMVRDETKYEKVITFGQVLPKIRKAVNKDLSLPLLPRRKVLATVVKLLEDTLIRVGNEEYARSNDSFGLTTMRDRHVKIEGSTVHFAFKGKSGVKHTIDLKDRRLAKIIQKCHDVPGQELFQYIDSQGEHHHIGSSDVNAYLHEISGENFTAKDFRTFSGTVLAAQALQEIETFDSKAQAKRNVVQAIERVAKRLGNTKAVCRKCYIHPAVLDAYLDGTLVANLQKRVQQELNDELAHLAPEEAAVLAFLQERLKRQASLHQAA